MPKLITDGSQMKCSLGSAPAYIQVTSQTFSQIEGASIATEVDKTGMTNIPSFGSCSRAWYRPSCTPNPMTWQQTAIENTINENNKLTDQSFCLCSYGGKIEFVDTGNNTFVEAE